MVSIMEVDNDGGEDTNTNATTKDASASAAASVAVAAPATSATRNPVVPKVGSKVKIHGLVNASQHNGKIGVVVKGAATTTGETENSQQRVGVKLLHDDSSGNKVLAVKLDNLEVVGVNESPAGKDAKAAKSTTKSSPSSSPSSSTTTEPNPKQRELKRQTGLLEEFDGSFEYDPNTLVLYYHLRDRAFDCFNSKEYQTQLLNYLNHGMTVRLVLPRKIHQQHKYWLVGLQYVDEPSRNVLCDVAFQAGRSFTGISMLVKHKCFHCGNPLSQEVELCKGCSCACFCQSCLQSKPQTLREHQQLVCDRIDKSKIIMETECIQLLE